MKRSLLILILLCFAAGRAISQAFTVDDLIDLSSLSSKNVDHFMNKKGFLSHTRNMDDNLMATGFFEKIKDSKEDTLTLRSVDLYKKDDSRYFVLHTSS